MGPLAAPMGWASQLQVVSDLVKGALPWVVRVIRMGAKGSVAFQPASLALEESSSPPSEMGQQAGCSLTPLMAAWKAVKEASMASVAVVVIQAWVAE